METTNNLPAPPNQGQIGDLPLNSEARAKMLDETDELKSFREEFLFPEAPAGKHSLYFCGNSLGLQPKRLSKAINKYLNKWANEGIEGYFSGETPWMDTENRATASIAKVVGAHASEVVVMNTLTVNIHLMMIHFFRPNKVAGRYKILLEDYSFPSDYHAIISQLKLHDLDPEDALLLLKPRPGEYTLRTDDILQFIETHGDSISLVILGGVQYYTGQVFDMEAITTMGHKKGCTVGFDLAHAAGNVPLHLHDWDVDFACWCSYKYLNSGPGAIGGCFVHERHHPTGPNGEVKNSCQYQLAGWWGHRRSDRFVTNIPFAPSIGAQGFQLSCPPPQAVQCLCTSLELFEEAGLERLRAKSIRLTGYLEELLMHELPGFIEIITPKNTPERGAQLSMFVTNPSGGAWDMEEMVRLLHAEGVVCDFRKPNIMRISPAPLYNSFLDVFRFVAVLKSILQNAASK